MNTLTPTPHPKSIFKNPYLYSSLIFFAVLVYVGFLMLSRYESNRAFNRRNAEKAAEQQREEDRAAIEQLGGSDLAIRSLYVLTERDSPRRIRPALLRRRQRQNRHPRSSCRRSLALPQSLRRSFPPENNHLHPHYCRFLRQIRLAIRRTSGPLVPPTSYNRLIMPALHKIVPTALPFPCPPLSLALIMSLWRSSTRPNSASFFSIPVANE